MNKSHFDFRASFAVGLGSICNLQFAICIFQSLHRWLSLALMLWVLPPTPLQSAEDWQGALGRMPLQTEAKELNRTNCVETMLKAFGSNEVVKALVFMPGATDELYLFRRAKAALTNSNPSLLDAVAALTNQTFISARYTAPFLLLQTTEDPNFPDNKIQDQQTAERLKKRVCVGLLACNDRDWDFLEPVLKKKLKIRLRPWRNSSDSWHFYRHSFAAWNVTGMEALELVSLAGKSKFVLGHNEARFEVDSRIGVPAKFDAQLLRH